MVEVAGIFDIDAVVFGELFKERGEGALADGSAADGVFRTVEDGFGGCGVLYVFGLFLGLVFFGNFFDSSFGGLRTPPMTRYSRVMNGAPGFGGRFECGFGLPCFEIGGGDLEAVEEEAGAAEVDLVGGDADEDLGERALNIIAIGGRGHVEGVSAGFAVARVFDGFSGLVVVIAEIFSAEGGAAALDSVGEDVAAAFAIVCSV